MADMGVTPAGSGYSAEPEPSCTVSAVPVSIPNAERLRRIHDLRMKAHWGKKHDTSRDPWPQTDADWRQTPHGAPWDSNVHMAEWHLKFARQLQAEGLL